MKLLVDDRSAYAYTGSRTYDPARLTVVFIHGAQHDHSVWILQSRYLAHHGYSVLAVDLPGHGRSDGPALPDVGQMADWVLKLLAACGAQRSVLVGHSMGSLIALDAAARAPAGLVAGVALLGSAAPMKVSDALLDAARSDESRAFDIINAWSHTDVFARPATPGPGFSIFVQNRRLMERQRPGVLLNDFQACNAYSHALDRADHLNCPAVVLMGGRDLMTPPRAAKALIERLTVSAQNHGLAAPETVQLAGCGHAMMSERPQAVLTALQTFLARLR
jgi:pimeloyl-ACP methyl ester carboxylesterase